MKVEKTYPSTLSGLLIVVNKFLPKKEMNDLSTLMLHLGENKIILSQVVQSCTQYINNWNAFVWYITEHAPVIKYGKNWVIIKIKSEEHLVYVCRKIKEYDPDFGENNYEYDVESDLYLTHNRGMDENANIIKHLVKGHENGE